MTRIEYENAAVFTNANGNHISVENAVQVNYQNAKSYCIPRSDLISETDKYTPFSVTSFENTANSVASSQALMDNTDPTEFGFISNTPCDINCEWNPNPSITLIVASGCVSFIPGITIISSAIENDYAAQITITWIDYQGESHSDTFYPDSNSYFCAFPMQNPTSITVTFNRWSAPFRCAKCSGLYLAHHITFTDNSIDSSEITEAVDFTSEEVEANSAQCTVLLPSNETFSEGQAFEIYKNDEFLGRFYTTRVKKKGVRLFFEGQDLVGELGMKKIPEKWVGEEWYQTYPASATEQDQFLYELVKRDLDDKKYIFEIPAFSAVCDRIPTQQKTFADEVCGKAKSQITKRSALQIASFLMCGYVDTSRSRSIVIKSVFNALDATENTFDIQETEIYAEGYSESENAAKGSFIFKNYREPYLNPATHEFVINNRHSAKDDNYNFDFGFGIAESGNTHTDIAKFLSKYMADYSFQNKRINCKVVCLNGALRCGTRGLLDGVPVRLLRQRLNLNSNNVVATCQFQVIENTEVWS